MSARIYDPAFPDDDVNTARKQAEEALLKAGALQSATTQGAPVDLAPGEHRRVTLR